MNKQKAFNQAKVIYPGLKPTRVGSYTLTDDGQGVIIAASDEDVVIVLYHVNDIYRLMNMCQIAIDRIKQK